MFGISDRATSLVKIIIVLVCVFAYSYITCDATDIVNSGVCGANGDNISWTIDDQGLLTLSGSGDMMDYADYSDTSPFYNNSNIMRIIIEDGITNIGNNMFYGCSKLETVNISDSVTSIGEGAFSYCTSITDVIVPDEVKNIGKWSFLGCKNLKRVRLPDGVTTIGLGAFQECYGLEEINLPDSVTSIAEAAFYSCNKLTSIHIPDRVTAIEKSTFYNSKLQSITIPEGVTEIGTTAFAGNYLSSVTIPSSLKTVGNNAFRGCRNTSVYISDVGAWCSIDFDNSLASPLYDHGYLYINGELATDIMIPDGVTSINENTFYYCDSLTSVTIPKSVTNIETLAFSSNPDLIIFGYKGSVAETYANEKGITFKEIGSGDDPYDPIQGDPVMEGYDGHYYQLFNMDLNWSDAQSYCETLGGHLATITDSGEQAFAESLLRDAIYECYWLGAYVENGTWKWLSGEDLSYTNWCEGEPNGGDNGMCLQMAVTGDKLGGWDDTWPSGDQGGGVKNHGFICEWDDYFILKKDNNNFLHKGSTFFNADYVFSEECELADSLRKNGFKVEVDAKKAQTYKNAIGMPFADHRFVDANDILGTDCRGAYASTLDEGGFSYYTAYIDELLAGCSDSNAVTIKKMMNSTWGGSCLGLEYSMVLLSEGRLNEILGDSDFYSLEEPRKSDKHLKDVINYYQLLQYKTGVNYDYYTLKRDMFNSEGMKESDDKKKLNEFLELLVDEAKFSQSEMKPFLLCYCYTVDDPNSKLEHTAGHVVIVCGYSYDSNKSEHVLKIYDCNHFDGYLELRVASDYESFNFTFGNNVVLQDTYSNLAYFGVETIEQYPPLAPLASKASSSAGRIAGSKLADDGLMDVSISAFKKCKIISSSGKTLIYDGNRYSGTMELYNARIIGDSKPYFEFKTPECDSFTITDIEKEGVFTVMADISGEYHRADTLGADSVILSNSSIVVDGDDYSYDITQEAKEDGVQAVSVAGIGEGRVTTSMNDKFSVKLENGSNNINVTTYTKEGDQNELIQEEVDEIKVDYSGQAMDIDKNIVLKDFRDVSVGKIKDYTYTGKALKPAIVAKDGNVQLEAGKDFSVSYSNNVKVGTAKVTITGKGSYDGKVSKTFKINPKPTILKSPTAQKKAFTAKWTKKTTQTTGYQLQYATNSKFTRGKKTLTIKKNSTVSKKVTKLKAKKKYYVRIRTYKTVSGKNYYSAWSKAKTVTTKK